MKKEPKINLSKCKIGQRVRLRNGEVKTITHIGNKKNVFPWNTDSNETYTKHGCYYGSGAESRLDIVAILPPAKAKKAVEPKRVGKKPDHLDPKWLEGEFDKQAIHRVSKLLKGLLKP